MGYYINAERDVQIFVEDINPSGHKTILFIHGWPGNHSLFEYQYNELPKRGYRFIAPVQEVGQVEPAEKEAAAAPAGKRRDKPRERVVFFVAGAMAAAGSMGVLWGVLRNGRPADGQVVEKFAFAPPGGAETPVISPDGKHIAYAAGKGEKRRVVRDGRADKEYDGILRGTPLYSADGRRCVYAAEDPEDHDWRLVVNGKETHKCEDPAPRSVRLRTRNAMAITVMTDSRISVITRATPRCNRRPAGKDANWSFIDTR
jgi:hypothetical protein